MPYVVNGIGTWYWGKRNISARRDTCASCNRVANLTSFDTTRFFVVLFVPVIPLGSLRIIDQCPVCTKHRVLSLKQWEKLKLEQVGDAGLKWREKPNDPDLATDLIRSAAAFQARAEFEGIVDSLPAELHQNPKVVGMLAAAYTHFSMHDQAEEAFRQLVQLRNDADANGALAAHLLQRGKPDEARPFVDRVLAEGKVDDMGLVYLTVEAYQAQGDHDSALTLLNACAARFPGVPHQPDFKKYHKLAAKHAGGRKRIKSALISGDKPGPRAPSGTGGGWRFRAARLVPVLVVLIALGIYFSAAVIRGTSRDVFVVNGTHSPYEVTIGPAKVRVPAKGRSTVKLPEGDHKVHITDATRRIADQTAAIHTPFFARPFLSRTFVINPDRLAVLEWEQAVYTASTTPGAGTQRGFKVHTGDALYEFKDIEYAFAPFPNTLSLQQKSGVETRRRIGLANMTMVEEVGAILTQLGHEKVVEHARLGVTVEPTHGPYFETLLALSRPAESLAAIEPLLKQRPVVVHAHRAYQELKERLAPDHDLEAEYRALLQAEPDDKTLKYLLGRVASDRAEGMRLFEAAAADPAPLALAFRAIAYDDLAQGRFEEGLAAARRGRTVDASDESVQEMERACLLALGRIPECLELPWLRVPDQSISLTNLLFKVSLLASMGKTAEALSHADLFLGAEADPETREFILARIDYCRGDLASYAKRLSSRESAESKFDAALTLGQVDEAVQFQAQAEKANDPMPELEPNLLLAIAARTAGKAQLADLALAAAITSLREGDRQDRAMAAWLSGQTTPKPGEPTALAMSHRTKAMALTLLADKACRDECRALARKLNFEPGFPRQLLARALAD